MLFKAWSQLGLFHSGRKGACQWGKGRSRHPCYMSLAFVHSLLPLDVSITPLNLHESVFFNFLKLV